MSAVPSTSGGSGQAPPGGAGHGAPSSGAAPSQRRTPERVHPLVEYGCTAGFVGVVGTIVVGLYGTIRGQRELTSRMLRTRLVLLGTTLGLYTTGTGFFALPSPVVAVFGPPKRFPLQG